MTPKVQTVQGERVLLKLGIWRVFPSTKARLVASGHRTKATAAITYASVVPWETVWLAPMIMALNALEVKVGDVINACITAPVKERVWTILGPDFGQDTGKSAIIVQALNGLKSSGAVFWAHIPLFMRQMGFKVCKADPNLWLEQLNRYKVPARMKNSNPVGFLW
jgi:hypothetical protein